MEPKWLIKYPSGIAVLDVKTAKDFGNLGVVKKMFIFVQAPCFLYI